MRTKYLAVVIVNDIIDLTDYSFLPNSLVSMLIYVSLSSTDEGRVVVVLRPNNKVVFSRTAQELE